ncbi:MAG TPA: glycosyltransferase family 9 protein [Edaphobacter sp.]
MSLKQSAKTLSATAILSAERVFRRPSISSTPESILILEFMLPLGCCVHLTPLYEAIKRTRPHVTLTVATRGLGRALLRHHPCIDHLIDTPDPLTDTYAAARALRSALAQRNLRPDCILTGASDQRTRIALLALLTGSGWRGGFTLAPQLYHRPLQYQREQSLIDNNLQLASLVGASANHIEPRVFFSPLDAAAVQQFIHTANPDARPLVVFVTQNSGGQSTGWHTDRFAEVIRHAHHALGCAIVYAGTAADVEAIEHIRTSAGGIGTSLAGCTSVTQLAALLAISDAAVSLDTGTMHIGRAVGTPMVVLGPSWQRPIEWLPLELPHVRILRGPDRPDVPPGYRLEEIQAPDVIATLENLLKAYPACAADRATRLAASTSTIDHTVGLAEIR